MNTVSDKLIGQILLTKGYLTPSQLGRAINKQDSNEQHQLLGRILLEMGFVTQPQLDEALELQAGILKKHMTNQF
jgi:hypothetical protein